MARSLLSLCTSMSFFIDNATIKLAMGTAYKKVRQIKDSQGLFLLIPSQYYCQIQCSRFLLLVNSQKQSFILCLLISRLNYFFINSIYNILSNLGNVLRLIVTYKDQASKFFFGIITICLLICFFSGKKLFFVIRIKWCCSRLRQNLKQ